MKASPGGAAEVPPTPALPPIPSPAPRQTDGGERERGDRLSASTPELTLDGEVLGTPAYMPPEQAAGRMQEMDSRSDLYSLGAILYEILTFHPPFEGKSVDEIISKVRSGRITPPSSRVRSAPVRARSPRDAEGTTETTTETATETTTPPDACPPSVWRGGTTNIRVEIAEDCTIPWRDGRPRPDLPLEDKDRPVPKVRVRIEGGTESPSSAPPSGTPESPSSAPPLGARIEGTAWGHTDRCPRREVRGVEVWIARYEEKDKRLVLGPERLLGVTPLAGVEVPHGSYRCTLRPTGGSRPRDRGMDVTSDRAPGAIKGGFTSGDRAVPAPTPSVVVISSVNPKPETRNLKPAFLPVILTRGETWEQEVNLYREEDIPEGFCQVPGGPCLAGEEHAGGGPTETRITDDFFIAKFPVTCGEYLEFLNDLAARSAPVRARFSKSPSKRTTESTTETTTETTTPPEGGTTNGLAEARARQPREGDKKYWIEEGGCFRLPTRAEDPKMEWDPRWPVLSINWFDSIAYVVWRSERDGRVYSLPHEEEFEKAARGVDGRVYPYGDDYDGTFSHTSVSVPGKASPMPVGAFPIDESPYGVRDLAGGMQTWCVNEPEVPYRGHRCLRGGAWSNTSNNARAANRQGNHPSNLNWNNGLRLAWRPRTQSPQPGGPIAGVHGPRRRAPLRSTADFRIGLGGTGFPACAGQAGRLVLPFPIRDSVYPRSGATFATRLPRSVTVELGTVRK